MKINTIVYRCSATLLSLSTLLSPSLAQATGEGWSIVPQFGLSQLADQSPTINADSIAQGNSDIAVDQGFSAGLSLRYDYAGTPWTSEFGWEYRSNDAEITATDGTTLPDGNYASNTFYINGRYAILERGRLTPWVGGGISWIQEIDLDSENADGERSFSDSGGIGVQVMVGADYNLSDRFYLSGEIRYSSQTGLDLDEENGTGQVIGIDYQPLTLGLGLGYRF